MLQRNIRMPNVKKAKKVLDWVPKVDLKEGLKKTIPWFKSNL